MALGGWECDRRTNVTNPGKSIELFYQLVVHETGHLFFLGDCPNCSGALTAMKDPQSRIISENANAPTDCDRIASAVYSNNRYPVPGFELTVDPVSREILSGVTPAVLYTATIDPTNGFNSPVSLETWDLSGYLNSSLVPNVITGGGTSQVIVSESQAGSTPVADYPFILSATWNGIVRTANLVAKVVDYDVVPIEPPPDPGVICIPSVVRRKLRAL